MSVGDVNVQTPGGFRVQYTDDARSQMALMSDTERRYVESTVSAIAAVNPYSRSIPTEELSDRRMAETDSADIIFWVSNHVKMLTVVDIRGVTSDANDAKAGRPPLNAHPYFLDDEEE
jgi:hypothetical protein